MMIQVYCDGGCRNNQSKTNIGGWGAVLQYKNNIKEIYGSTINTTNNIMELTSCIEALKVITNKSIPDVVKGMNEWINNWIKKGWKTSQKKPVENQELWKELLKLKNEFKDIKFIHCKGHADNKGNIKTDELANIAMDELNKRKDSYHESD